MPATATRLEQVPCAVCELDDARHLLTKNALRIVQCRRCGLVYVNPRPAFDALTELYAEEDYCQGQVNAAADAKRTQQATQRLRLIERYVGKGRRAVPSQRGRLLDVGCSTGIFLRAARDAGWQVSGIDVSAAAVEYGRSAHGLDMHAQTLEECDFPPQSFDAITMFDSIEHMPHPVAALRAAHWLLKDDGLLVITTPSVDGLFPRLTYRLFAQTIGAWEHPTPPGHIYQFSRQTMRAALEKSGFTSVYCRTEAIPAPYTVGKLEEAIVGALKKEGSGLRVEGSEGNGNPSPQNPKPKTQNQPSILRRAFRLGVRAMCWGLVLPVSVPAPWLGQGDSMLMFARKKQQ
jgi:2-polyprenyl-3-methyl-5-hydroxy-6-metoxy-1,4-benzoquinol methylase